MKKYIRLLGALATIVALTCTGIMAVQLPSVADDTNQNCETIIESGNLEWGVKESFRSYIKNTRIGGDGEVELNGVTGEYTWPVTPSNSNLTDIHTSGSVHYTKHHGALDMTISNVRLVQENGSWVIRADIKSKSMSTGTVNDYKGIKVAELTGAQETKTATSVTINFSGATLSQEAVAAFGNYQAGAEMDVPTLTLAVTEKCASTPQPTTDPTAPETCTAWNTVENKVTLDSMNEKSQGITDASLTWGFSEYAQEWKGEALAGATYDSDTKLFTLTGGIGQTDGDKTRITWQSDIKLYPYGNANYPGMGNAMKAMNFHFTSPELVVNGDGSGTLTMTVSSTGMAGTESEAKTVTVANFAVGTLAIDKSNKTWYSFTGTPSYEGQTYSYTTVDRRTGQTINGTADASWPAEFIDALDSSLRAYWYKSGASKDGAKAPLSIAGSFNVTHTHVWKNGEETLKKVVVTSCENAPAAPSTPTRDGYTFAGWKKLTNDSGTITTYSAQWTANSSGDSNAQQDGTATKPSQQADTKEKCVIDPTKTRVTSGSLTWGLRSSFTSYIRGSIANGSISGSAWGNGSFTFTAKGGLFDTKAKTGTLYFSGDAHFTGHGGKLDMTIANPYIVVNGNTGRLYMDVKSTDTSGKEKVNLTGVHFADIVFASADITNTSANLKATSVTLTAAGAQAFAGYYSAGEALDPLEISVSLVPDSECDGSGNKVTYDAFGRVRSGALASTGVSGGASIALALASLCFGVALAVRKRTYERI